MLTPRQPPSAGLQPWTRERLLLALAAGAVVIATLIAGLGLILLQVFIPPTSAETPGTPAPATLPDTSGVRDRIAAEPMASLDPAAATRPDPATEITPTLRIPHPDLGRGPAGVPVYGHTPEGAVAQLAAIDRQVLEAMSLPQAREVHAAWVLPGGPAFAEWDLTVNISGFLRGARQGATKDAPTVVRVAPAGGLVKGSDGPDWLVACVLLDVRAAIQGEYRMGWAHCQRMQWQDGRWLIAPGAQPAAAPSAWPGSKAALAAGWLAWVEDGEG